MATKKKTAEQWKADLSNSRKEMRALRERYEKLVEKSEQKDKKIEAYETIFDSIGLKKEDIAVLEEIARNSGGDKTEVMTLLMERAALLKKKLLASGVDPTKAEIILSMFITTILKDSSIQLS